MRSVAFLTSACMIEGHPKLRADYWEHDRELGPLRAACSARGIDLQAVVWDDPTVDPAAFAAFVIGTTWDYTDRPEAFVAALAEFAARRPLFNPLPVVRWNLGKSYLKDLSARGVPVVPTLWRDRADEATVAAAFDTLGADEIVVKPEVGASAWRQVRLTRGEALPPPAELPPARAMIQPFLSAATTEGEYSFLFFDRVFSHCARKIPPAGEYRVQSMYGGHEREYPTSPAERALAQRVVDAVDGPLLYARVDMMRDACDRLVVMELELIEPYLYPDQGPAMGDAFAAALERMLGS